MCLLLSEFWSLLLLYELLRKYIGCMYKDEHSKSLKDLNLFLMTDYSKIIFVLKFHILNVCGPLKF